MDVRPAVLSDIPALVELLGVLFAQEADFEPDPQKQERALRLIIESPQAGVVLVAPEESEIAGMVSLLFTISTAAGGPACWLEDMVVRPDQRERGVGSRLLSSAIAYARERGFTRIALVTDATNEGAIRFYDRHGFRRSEMTVMRLPL